MAGKFAVLEKACGGAINPETLTALRERIGSEPPPVRAEYFEFMAGLAALLGPPKKS